MKRMISAALICLLLVSLLTACGGRDDASSTNNPLSEIMSQIKESAETAADSPETEPIPETTLPPETTREPETTQEPEPQPDYDLDGYTAMFWTDFRNGYAWIHTDSYTALVDVEGFERFRLNDTVIYASAVEKDDTAFVVIREGKSYREVIYDVNGTERYSTTTVDTSTSLSEEHILAHGDGKYVTMRHSSGLTADGWTFGTIDPDGNVIDDYQAYTLVLSASMNYTREAGESAIPDWKRVRDFCYSYDAMAYNGFLERVDDLPRYLGDDIFYIPDLPAFFMPGKREMLYARSGKGLPLGGVEDGVFVAYQGDYVAYDMKDDTNWLIDVPKTKYGAPLLFERGGLSNGVFFSDHGYYTPWGEQVISISDYDELLMVGSEFRDGYAMLALMGADKNRYITMIDQNGAIQFEPFQVDAVSQNTENGLFAAYNSENGWAIYDHSGALLRSLPEITEGSIFNAAWFSEGFFRIGYDLKFSLYDLRDLIR